MEDNRNRALFFQTVFAGALGEKAPALTANCVPDFLEWGSRFHVYGILAYDRAFAALCPEAERRELEDRAYRITRRLLVQENEQQKVLAFLNAQNIPFILLKGAVIRRLYPEKEMRPSVDVDIFYDRRFRDKVRTGLPALGFALADSDPNHDVFAQKFVKFEMHHNLLCQFPEDAAFFEGIWERAEAGEGAERRFCTDDLYIYHLLHAKRHFISGEMNLLMLTDLLLLHRLPDFSAERLAPKLSALRLTGFEKSLFDLATSLAAGKPLSPEEEEFFTFAYLAPEDHSLSYSRYTGKGSRAGYYFKNLFPSFSYMKEKYPALQKAPLLLPFYWGKRIVGFLFGKKKVSVNEKADATELFRRLSL